MVAEYDHHRLPSPLSTVPTIMAVLGLFLSDGRDIGFMNSSSAERGSGDSEIQPSESSDGLVNFSIEICPPKIKLYTWIIDMRFGSHLLS